MACRAMHHPCPALAETLQRAEGFILPRAQPHSLPLGGRDAGCLLQEMKGGPTAGRLCAGKQRHPQRKTIRSDANIILCRGIKGCRLPGLSSPVLAFADMSVCQGTCCPLGILRDQSQICNESFALRKSWKPGRLLSAGRARESNSHAKPERVRLRAHLDPLSLGPKPSTA